MNGLQRREKSTVPSMDKRIKTTPEFSDKTWKILQQAKMVLATKKIMPQYQEYLKLREEIHANFPFKNFTLSGTEVGPRIWTRIILKAQGRK
jgi:hypothetical protein